MTTTIVVAETLVLGLLAVLVVGLLRSHAEILRRLEPSDPPRRAGNDEFDARIPQPPDHALGGSAHAIAGTTLDGDALQLGFAAGGPDMLLAFLSSGCLVCQEFWDAFGSEAAGDLPEGVELLILTKDTTHESPSKLSGLAPQGTRVVMSSSAWESYDVPVAPYFVYVHGPTGRIHGEGAAAGWEQLLSLFSDFLHDREAAGGNRHEARARRANQSLLRAGVSPDDPSLYDSPQLPEDEPDLRVFDVGGHETDPANA